MALFQILIINPNTTKSMTNNLRPLVESLDYQNTTYTYFTAPSGPSSINDNHDAAESAIACLTALEEQHLLHTYDAFLVACYSLHPLVPALRSHLSKFSHKHVVGIFEASITATLSLLPIHAEFPTQRSECTGRDSAASFGIVSTGKQWEDILSHNVGHVLGMESGSKWFAGVETTGLNASELHEIPEEEVRRRIRDAARRLAKRAKDLRIIVLGCAGMVGMEGWVREGAGKQIFVVDGVKAGVSVLQALLRGNY